MLTSLLGLACEGQTVNKKSYFARFILSSSSLRCFITLYPVKKKKEQEKLLYLLLVMNEWLKHLIEALDDMLTVTSLS